MRVASFGQQRASANRISHAALGRLQTKLTVNVPGDQYEQEADRIAEQVMRMPAPQIQRECSACGKSHPAEGQCSECKKKKQPFHGTSIQRQPSQSGPVLGAEATSSVDQVINSPGAPLPVDTRSFMEQRFGYDFSHVRVHTGSVAAQSAEDINAQAYTLGNNVVFGAGKFSPCSDQGKQLLAHELTHVIQQSDTSCDLETLRLKPDTPVKGKATKEKDPREKQPKAEGTKQAKPKAELSQRFDSQESAKREADRLTRLGIGEVELSTRNKKWIINFRRLSLEDAKKEAALKQPTIAAGLEAGTAYDDASASHYVKIYLKCPEGVPPKTGFHIWDTCFTRGNAKANAEKMQQKLIRGHGQAELFERPDAYGFAVYYKALTSQDLQSQRKAAEAQLDSEKSQKPMDKCPEGYTDKGKYRLTTYYLPLESEFPEKPTKIDPCGLKGTFRDEFLNAVVLQGSGVSIAGQFIQFSEKKGKEHCYKVNYCNATKLETCATIGRTVAVDRGDIPLGSELLIEGVGERVAEDTGGMVNDKHIDIYRGPLTQSVVRTLTLNDKRVCIKSRKK